MVAYHKAHQVRQAWRSWRQARKQDFFSRGSVSKFENLVDQEALFSIGNLFNILL